MDGPEGIALRLRHRWLWFSGLGVLAFTGFLWLNGAAETCLDEDWAAGLRVGGEQDPGVAELAFFRRYGRESGVLVADVSSGEERELVRGQIREGLALSPDGAHIAFTSYTQNPWDGRVMVMDRDGTNLGPLIDREVPVASAPAWSPDGSQLALAKGFVGPEARDTRDLGVMVMDREGTDVRHIVEGIRFVDGLVWSPDSRRIAFSGALSTPRNAKGTESGVGLITNVGLTAVASFLRLDIFVVDADGANLRKLADGGGSEWSPDGRQILFVPPEGRALGTVEVASGDIRILTRHLPGFATRTCHGEDCWSLDPTVVRFTDASWSPDGGYILFTADRDGDFEVFLMDASAENVCQLTDNESQEWHPVWSPDGSHIAFSSDRDGNVQIYVMDMASTAVTQITEDDRRSILPVWLPGSR